MNTNPLTLLPAKARQVIYTVYGMLALAGTGATAYFAALPHLTMPDQLIGALAVLGALAAPIGVLAAVNVQPSRE